MMPKRWNAGQELQALRERMSRLFEEEPRAGKAQGAFAPATDVYLTEDRVVITVELPGLDLSSVAITSDGMVLTISGERTFSGEGHCHQIERSYGPFLRILPLPQGVIVENQTTRFEDGLLTVELPRRVEP